MDPKDPILAAYRRAFPGVFKDLDQLSPDLKSHLRYPEDFFAIQADEYKTFHMTILRSSTTGKTCGWRLQRPMAARLAQWSHTTS